MDELLEARKFNAELDRLLAGETPAEAKGDLAFAAQLLRSDLSRESRVRKTLKLGLLGYATEKAPSPWRFNWRMAGAYAGAFMVLMAPLAFHLISEPDKGERPMGPAFDEKSVPYQGDAGVAELGSGDIARGGLPGAAGDVVTPLNVRDRSGLAVEGSHDGLPRGLQQVASHPAADFPLQVGGSGYSDMLGYLKEGRIPPEEAVRVADFVDHFQYIAPVFQAGSPLSVEMEAAVCPWNRRHALVLVSLGSRTILRGVSATVTFSPSRAEAYYLIGHEESPTPEDVHDGATGPGSLEPGHASTALYEVVPADSGAGELLRVDVSYKASEGGKAGRLSRSLTGPARAWSEASPDFKFAAAVAGIGLLMRDSPVVQGLTYRTVEDWAREGKGPDKDGARQAFIEVVDKARTLPASPRLLR